ncbi:hypothetical protein ACQHIV_36110 [Kribbella sp. GL6]|uniref:hypothetical protein n=1 Tax=Kribbella sp. GL6 TaxID=3419765 RepID=UPI003CFD395D
MPEQLDNSEQIPAQPYLPGTGPGIPRYRQPDPPHPTPPSAAQPTHATPPIPQPQPQPQQFYQPAPYQPFPPMMPMQQIKAKNPGLACVLSILVPGLGQFLNGDIGLGIGMFVVAGIAWFSLLWVIGFLLLPAVYIWSAVEAYNAAQRWNTQHGVLS